MLNTLEEDGLSLADARLRVERDGLIWQMLGFPKYGYSQFLASPKLVEAGRRSKTADSAAKS